MTKTTHQIAKQKGILLPSRDFCHQNSLLVHKFGKNEGNNLRHQLSKVHDKSYSGLQGHFSSFGSGYPIAFSVTLRIEPPSR
jgi:hypothetical protein